MIEELLRPISEEHPTGMDIADDPLWPDLAQARLIAASEQRGEDDSASRFGRDVSASGAWRRVRELSEKALLEHSKDIRVALWWTEACARIEGFGGATRGLLLVRRLLETFPGQLHPKGEGTDVPAGAAAQWLNRKFPPLLSDIPLVEHDGRPVSYGSLKRTFQKEGLTGVAFTIKYLDRQRLEESLQAGAVLEDELDALDLLLERKFGIHLDKALNAFAREISSTARGWLIEPIWPEVDRKASLQAPEQGPAGEVAGPRPQADVAKLVVYDFHLRIETIPGESSDRNYPKWIVVQSFTHRLGPADAKGPDAIVGAEHGDFEIVKPIDRASPKLYEACCSRSHFKVVTLDVRKQTGENTDRFLRIEMEDAFVRSVVSTAGRNETSPQSETVRFAYRRIRWTYTKSPGDGIPGGSISSSWDLGYFVQ